MKSSITKFLLAATILMGTQSPMAFADAAGDEADWKQMEAQYQQKIADLEDQKKQLAEQQQQQQAQAEAAAQAAAQAQAQAASNMVSQSQYREHRSPLTGLIHAVGGVGAAAMSTGMMMNTYPSVIPVPGGYVTVNHPMMSYPYPMTHVVRCRRAPIYGFGNPYVPLF